MKSNHRYDSEHLSVCYRKINLFDAYFSLVKCLKHFIKKPYIQIKISKEHCALDKETSFTGGTMHGKIMTFEKK